MRGRLVAAGAAWAAALAVAGLALYDATTRSDLFPDLTVYRAAAGAIGHGGSALYSVHGSNGGGFTYPPFAALVLSPLRLPSLMVAGVMLAVASWLAAATTARLALRGSPAWLTGVVLACAWETVPFRNTFFFGQIGVLLMLLVALDLLVQDPPWPRGLLIGIAAGVKLTPGLFIVFLVLVRRPRAARTALATFAASIVLAAALLPRQSWRYWTSTAWHTNRVGDIAGGRNRSLWGLMAHAGAPTALTVAACAVVAVAGLLWAASAYEQSRVAATAAVGLVGCLVSPITWTHHLVWVLLALCAVATQVHHRTSRIVMVAAVTAAYARLSPDTHLLSLIEASMTALLVIALPWNARHQRHIVPELSPAMDSERVARSAV